MSKKKHKLKTAGKVMIGGAVALVVLVALLLAIPVLFKDKINSKVKEEINSRVNAKVDYADYSLSLIRSFPDFNFSLENFSVVGTGAFKNDTLLSVDRFSFSVDLMSVIKGEKYKVQQLSLIKPIINARVNYEGKANWDIMKPTPAAATADQPTNFTLEIKKYKIENGNITYDDKPAAQLAVIRNLNFEGSGNVTQDVYDLVTTTSIQELSYKSGAVSYLSNAKLAADIKIAVDNLNSKYTFGENTLSLNDLALQFEGYVQNKKQQTDLDVKFKSKQTEFKSILSLIPSIYKTDFDKIKTSGSLALSGLVKGIYSDKTYPGFNLDLKISNGMFQYPNLPVAVKNIAIAANIAKPQGDLDLTVIDIARLHLDAGTDPIDARIKVSTPISNPNVLANIAGRLNLANVPKFYPMEGLKTLTGQLSMNLDFKGKKSDVDTKNYQAISAAGQAKVSNLVYDSKETPMAVRVMDMQLAFSPQNITLSNFSSAIGKSDINATGTLDNFMAYLFGKGDLLGKINLRSAQFDANEWLSKDEKSANPTPADTAKSEYFKVPAHIDFTANSQFGKILYEKLVLENVKGEVIVKDEAIYLNDLFANLLGGNATISAVYNTKGKSHPDVSFTYDINNFDIQKTYQAVGMSEKLAPVIKYVQGNFSSDLKGSGKLNEDMSVDYNSLTGDGKVEIPSAKIVGLPILAKVTEVAKIPALQNLELKDAWTVLKFKDGRVAVEPTNIKFGNGYNVNVQGTNGFDQSINYDMRMDVPSKELGAATSLAQGYLAKVPGFSGAMPEIISFMFNVTGSTAKPQVKLTGIKSGGGSAKEILTNAADDLKKKAEEEAKKKADELKKQAEDALAKQKADLERQAREAAEKAKKDAADKLKDVLKFPRR